jgi:hypothetical protein
MARMPQIGSDHLGCLHNLAADREDWERAGRRSPCSLCCNHGRPVYARRPWSYGGLTERCRVSGAADLQGGARLVALADPDVAVGARQIAYAPGSALGVTTRASGISVAQVGTYYLVCLVLGHVQLGMFAISATARLPSIQTS